MKQFFQDQFVLALILEYLSLLQQLQQYQKTADEYQLASNNKTPALYILEDAVPAAKAEKPKKLEILFLTAITSFCFGVFASLAYSRNKMA